MDQFLIIRLSSLGDIIHTLPAYSTLRRNFPQAKISWLTEEKGKDILELIPGLERIITSRIKKWPFYSQKFWQEFSCLKKELKNKNHKALDFQGLIKSGFMAFLSNAPQRIGFHRKNLKEPLASIFYTHHLQQIPENIHVIEKNLKLLSLLGVEQKIYNFPLEIPPELTNSITSKLVKTGYHPSRKLILLNVGAAWETKRWFPERWVELAEVLKKDKTIFPLLLWGTEEERSVAFSIHLQTDVPLAPFLTLKGIIALIKESSLLISGDTFALQAACALSCPVVGIFGPTNPQRNGPFRSSDKTAFHRLECSYCYKRTCSSLECLKKIKTEEVASYCFQLIKNHE